MVLEGRGVRSLTWAGDELVDWVGGGARYRLDGTVTERRVNYAYRFDAVTASEDGRTAVIYERLGTKGLVLRDGKILRELNRSFYHAHAYEYPVCLWTDAAGRTLLAHCPDEFCRVEIEDALTGERLTSAETQKPEHFFHSRLQANPSGTRLLSSGFIWHPLDTVYLLDIQAAQKTPCHMGWVSACNSDTHHEGLVHESSACWQSDDRLLIAGGESEEEPEDDAVREDPLRLRSNGIAVFDVPSRKCIAAAVMTQPAGRMMPVGEDHVVAFYEHPQLISLSDGEAIEAWPDLPSGRQESSILIGVEPLPPMALDPKKRRFAIARGDEIHVISV